ncbi:MAG: dTDP-4-dehydrorhamnose reductase [Euryarchaeota archaeon]|nr:dTDP-4-dehydrorhamnose reductase [Euryarchaeota archaeon]
MKRLFITGGSGLLGSKFVNYKDNYEIILTYHHNPYENSIKLDITSKKNVLKKITSINPDCVIHSAAFTNVDECEDQQKKAWNINVRGTENIVKACQETESKLIHISTDFVFDGKLGMYEEEDQANPLGYYALTKLKGEEVVQNSDLNYAIARVSVLYGWHKRNNFVTWVIGELENNNDIKVVTDQYNSPTFADNAAYALLKIIEKNKNGIYHVAGNERINRFDFAKNIAKTFDLDTNLINPINSDELIQKATRPKDSSLCVEKAQKELGIKLLNTKEGLGKMKLQKEKRVKE